MHFQLTDKNILHVTILIFRKWLWRLSTVVAKHQNNSISPYELCVNISSHLEPQEGPSEPMFKQHCSCANYSHIK